MLEQLTNSMFDRASKNENDKDAIASEHYAELKGISKMVREGLISILYYVVFHIGVYFIRSKLDRTKDRVRPVQKISLFGSRFGLSRTENILFKKKFHHSKLITL